MAQKDLLHKIPGYDYNPGQHIGQGGFCSGSSCCASPVDTSPEHMHAVLSYRCKSVQYLGMTLPGSFLQKPRLLKNLVHLQAIVSADIGSNCCCVYAVFKATMLPGRHAVVALKIFDTESDNPEQLDYHVSAEPDLGLSRGH